MQELQINDKDFEHKMEQRALQIAMMSGIYCSVGAVFLLLFIVVGQLSNNTTTQVLGVVFGSVFFALGVFARNVSNQLLNFLRSFRIYKNRQKQIGELYGR